MRTAVLLPALLLGCATTKQTTADKPGMIRFSANDLDGQPVEPADFAGKVVLVDVWATWCKPCLASFPFYSDLHARYGDKGLVILAVSVDESVDDVRSFVAERNVPFKIAHDPTGKVPEQLEVKTMPTAYLIGRDGAVLHVHPGFYPKDQPDIEKRIKEALGL